MACRRKRFEIIRTRALEATAVIALTLTSAGSLVAQSAANSATAQSAKYIAPPVASSTAAMKTSASPASPKGMSTGIKVHGHWIIEVRNPDGSLVTHREFENEIQVSGVATLASLLARTATPGAWAIGLGDPVSPPCATSMAFVSFAIYYTGAVSQGCFIGEPSGVYAAPCAAANGCSPNLAISTFSNGSIGIPPHTGPASGCQTAPAGADVLPCLPVGPENLLGFELKGYAVAQQAGQVTLVETTLMGCGPATAPGTCSTTTSPGVTSNETFSAAAGGYASGLFVTNFGSVFTGTFVPGSPIQVGSGQAVNATVQISIQ
ncbi:MAG: hypothetical protein WA197_00140 [Candidatus Acidiferrales bacterium]